MKEKKNTENLASGLGAAVGSLSGTIVAQAMPNDVVDMSDTIEEIFGGPVPVIEPDNPDWDDPIPCIYGPPERDIYPDLDISNLTDEFPEYDGFTDY